ncbi:hypothetical protein SAMN05421747_104120 [Parapedobacter composti]|uniref:Uncharacterized protein n=1 Tax=Parapedobacter composti TaxID=623281 RepID=A0A1I1GD59_9SPHI|nr:hypothetical protein SAMN05421747_104120 [Parapedobacter composti]
MPQTLNKFNKAIIFGHAKIVFIQRLTKKHIHSLFDIHVSTCWSCIGIVTVYRLFC